MTDTLATNDQIHSAPVAINRLRRLLQDSLRVLSQVTLSFILIEYEVAEGIQPVINFLLS